MTAGAAGDTGDGMADVAGVAGVAPDEPLLSARDVSVSFPVGSRVTARAPLAARAILSEKKYETKFRMAAKIKA